MPSALPRYNLRIDPELLKKLAYVAEYNGRTINKEIEFLTKQHIEKFETEYGKINLDET